MYNNLRINRRLLKNEARMNFVKHRNPCFAIGIILVAAELLLTFLANHFIPFLSVEIPTYVLSSADTLSAWYENYINITLPSMMTEQNFIIMGIIVLLTVLVLTPIRFTGYEVAMKINSDRETTLKDLGDWFLNARRLFGCVGLYLWTLIKTAFWCIVYLIIPCGIIVGAGFLYNTAPAPASMLMSVGYVASVAAVFFTLLRFSCYSLSFYTYAEHDDIRIGEAIRSAKKIYKGRMWEVFVLYLSFIVWYILNSFTYGVINIYLTPYINLTVAGFIRNVRAVENGNYTVQDDTAPDHDESENK